MKFAIIFSVFAICCILTATAYPIEEVDDDESQVARVRVRRFTCDVLSVEAGTVKLNHSACAVHCLFRLKSGGYCNHQRVCICR
uniref:Defensin n=1 Tax=Anatolica polita TaxID=442710 RepID=A0A1P8NW51_9CUCU|nr:defensin [Anatolica polita]